MKYWTAYFVGGPLNGKTELCRGESIDPVLKSVSSRDGASFREARYLSEDTTPIENAYLVHEYHEYRTERVLKPDGMAFIRVYYYWAGEPKIPQVEGVL